jgi:hypothetical protein
VFLEAWQGPEAPYDRWRAYFHTDDLDGIEAALKAAGVAHAGPATTEYGMREIEVADPDGNVVCFRRGCGGAMSGRIIGGGIVVFAAFFRPAALVVSGACLLPERHRADLDRGRWRAAAGGRL